VFYRLPVARGMIPMVMFRLGRPLRRCASQPPAHRRRFPSGARGAATPFRAGDRRAGRFAPLTLLHRGDAAATARLVRRVRHDFADAFAWGAGVECLLRYVRHVRRDFAAHTTQDRAPHPPVPLRSLHSTGPRRYALHFVVAPKQTKVSVQSTK
jgi:hypothetical protein